MHGVSKYTLNGIFSMILNFNKLPIVPKPKKITTTFYIHLKNVKVLRDTRTAFWLPFAHARHGSIAPRRARTCWFVTGQWLHVEPTCVAWFSTAGSIVASESCLQRTHGTVKLDPAFVLYWHLVKFTGIWSTSIQCADSQSRAEVKRLCECRGEWIADLVWLNPMLAPMIKIYVAWLMCHVYKCMCYSFLELKLKINKRSLFNRTLSPAHPPLLCCALLALRSIQLMTGEPRPRYNALQ